MVLKRSISCTMSTSFLTPFSSNYMHAFTLICSQSFLCCLCPNDYQISTSSSTPIYPVTKGYLHLDVSVVPLTFCMPQVELTLLSPSCSPTSNLCAISLVEGMASPSVHCPSRNLEVLHCSYPCCSPHQPPGLLDPSPWVSADCTTFPLLALGPTPAQPKPLNCSLASSFLPLQSGLHVQSAWSLSNTSLHPLPLL